MKISLSLCLAAILVTSQGASHDRTRLQAISPELAPMLESFGGETDHPADYDRVKRDEVTKLSAVAPDITRLESISPDLLESFGADFDQLSESERVKRAGSIFSFIGNKLSSGISSIAHASSGLKSKITGDGHGEVVPEYGPPVESYGHKAFDVWSFKKSILHTLLQAVKAINGGIIAINGQLIKGAGYVVETNGRILQQKGEKIFEFGKGIANNALLSPPKTHGTFAPFRPAAPHHGHSAQLVDVHHTETYTAPSGHDAGYGGHPGYGTDEYTVQAAPLGGSFASFGGSAPGLEYGEPHFQVARAVTAAPAQEAKPETNHYDEQGVKAGLLVLKPISSYDERANSYSRSLQTPANDYKSASKEHASAYHSTKRQSAVPEYESAKRQAPEYESAKRQVPEYESAKRQAPEYESAKRQVPAFRSTKPQESSPEYTKRQAPLPEYRSAPRQAPVPEYEPAKRQAEYQSAKRQESLSGYRSAKSPAGAYQSVKLRQAPSSLYLAPSNKYSVFAPPPQVYSQPAASYSARSYRALPPPAAFYRTYSLQQPTYDPSLGYALPRIEYE